jgi:outer membrane immunogenic protein
LANFTDNCRSSKTLFTGGAQVGYNLQSGNLVYGLEADINAVGGGNDSTRVRQFDQRNLVIRGVGDPSVYGTIRARLGLSADRALFYVTGGLAWAAGGNDPRVTDVNAVYSRNGRRDIGWTAGLGAEYAFTNNWTARVEYLYVDLGKEDNAWSCSGTCPPDRIDLAGRKDAHFNVVRVGVNYKFGGSSSSAVVARY